MKHQEIFKGTVVEVLNASYLNIETKDKEIIPCYIVKKVSAKGWTPNVGTPAIFKGGFKTFANGTNYFVVHKIENYALGVYNNATYVDKNEELPYLQRVHKAIESAPCRKNMSKKIACELVDASNDEKFDCSISCWNDEISFWNSCCSMELVNGRYESSDKYVFHTPEIFDAFNKANLANKKWGSKIEGKLRIEIIGIRKKVGAGASWEDFDLENIPPHHSFIEEIKKIVNSGINRFRSKHYNQCLQHQFAAYEATKVRIVVQR